MKTQSRGRPRAPMVGLMMLCLAAIPLAHMRGAHGVPRPRLSTSLPGATFALNGDRRQPALIITSLRSGGEASLRGVRVGDRIETIDRKPVATPAQLKRVLRGDRRAAIELRLRRGAQRVAVTLRRAPAENRHGA